MIALNKLRVLSESANYHDSDFMPGIGFDDLQDFDESAFTFNDFDSEDSINESIGSEIWKKIKAAFHAIRKFFIMIGTKIRNFVLGFFKKNDDELDDFIKNDLDNKAKNATDPEKVVNDIKKEAGEAIKKRHDEFKKRVEDFDANIKKDAEENKKTAESIDKSFEDLNKMLNDLNGSFREDLDRIKNIGNYCEKVKQKNPKLANDILDILEGKEPAIKRAAANQKRLKKYSGRITLYEYARDRGVRNDLTFCDKATDAVISLVHGERSTSKFSDDARHSIFGTNIADYVSSIISGKNADKSEFGIDDTEINRIRTTLDQLCNARIDKTDKNFLSHLGIVYCNKTEYGVSLIPHNVKTKTLEVTNYGVSDLIDMAKSFNGTCKTEAKGWQSDFDKAVSEINQLIRRIDSYEKDPKSGEYAEIFKKHAQVCNKIIGVIQFASSVYSTAFTALSKKNTQRIKAFVDSERKQYAD